jgi:hypothetical protein
MDQQVFTAKEASEKLGVPLYKILRALRLGLLNGHKKGWIWLIDEDALIEAQNKGIFDRKKRRPRD